MPGRTKRILLTIDVRPADRAAKCSHDKRHAITKGQTRVVIKNPGGVGERGYCASCALDMVILAKFQLGQLETQLTTV